MTEKDSGNHSLFSKEGLIQAVKTPLGFFALIVLVTDAVLGIVATSSDAVQRGYLIAGMIGVLFLLIVIVAVMAIRYPEALLALDASQKQIKSPEIVIPAQACVTNCTIIDYGVFGPIFDQYLEQADGVVMIGTGLSVLHNEGRISHLLQKIKEGCQVEIYAANPFSPHVETRLIEEETTNPQPPIAQTGLKRWLKGLVKEKEYLGGLVNFTLKLFPYYPTYALFIFRHGERKNYFYYPYGYAQLGTSSPVFGYSNENAGNDAMTRFLDSQRERIQKDSTDAKLIFDLYDGNDVKPDELVAFAVYIVPPSNSLLYQFGSDVLGYDVHKKSPLITKWASAAGAAADFGFHLTLADALYCANTQDIRLICEEVQFLAQGFQPFKLSVHLEKDFPNSKGIALVCDDQTGSIEALHHEMVARVYRKAVASNYSLNLAVADRDNARQRAELMIKRYHAPYILQRFKPHFSLLSNVPEEKKEQIFSEIKKLYEKRAVDSVLDVRSISIMERPSPNGRWQIYREYKLGG